MKKIKIVLAQVKIFLETIKLDFAKNNCLNIEKKSIWKITAFVLIKKASNEKLIKFQSYKNKIPSINFYGFKYNFTVLKCTS